MITNVLFWCKIDLPATNRKDLSIIIIQSVNVRVQQKKNVRKKNDSSTIIIISIKIVFPSTVYNTR